MKRFIFGERNGIYIIDLQKTLRHFQEAYDFVKSLAAEGKDLLFVGTKKQAQATVEEEAKRCGMHYVTSRWLGGTLTNFATIRSRTERLLKLEQMKEQGNYEEGLTKKEILKLEKERQKLEAYLCGIKEMASLPGAIFVVDPKREEIAVHEARRLGIPVVAIVDTNCDPDEIDYPIPGNDDAIRAIRLITAKIADAVQEGRTECQAAAEGGEQSSGEERLAEAGSRGATPEEGTS